MAKKVVDRMALLTDLVKKGFAKAEKLPTAGQIIAYLKVEHRKRVDYQTARNIQRRIQRAFGKKEAVTKPAKISEPMAGFKPQEPAAATPMPAGQLRHTGRHG
jgi:hypothetical protein